MSPEASGGAGPKRSRSAWWKVALVGALALLAAGTYAVYRLGGRETTDDAFVEATLVRIAAQLPGRVAEVSVGEHERVRAGQLLLRLDAREYELAREAARAGMDAARNRIAEAEAAAASTDAQRKAARVELWRAERELARAEELAKRGASSQRALDTARAARDAAQAQARALRLRAEAERALLGNRAPLHQAEAALARAELDLSHTEVRAPFDGTIGRKGVDVGAVVAPGQSLLSLVAASDFYVMANFKETQIRRMRRGSRARVRVDAFPGRVWRGHVASFSPATGAKYALIAPEPAAGNFTKVTQRVPVKITLDGPEDDPEPSSDPEPGLAAGLSAEVTVLVE